MSVTVLKKMAKLIQRQKVFFKLKFSNGLTNLKLLISTNGFRYQVIADKQIHPQSNVIAEMENPVKILRMLEPAAGIKSGNSDGSLPMKPLPPVQWKARHFAAWAIPC